MNISRKRSLTKAVTYRFIMTIVLIVISYVFTGDIYQTSSIVGVFTIIAIIVYYFHERIWNKITWGRKYSR
jgi:uncharacterized membrane protein